MVDSCKRNFTVEELIEVLAAGHTLCVDRIGTPELPELDELWEKGLVTRQLVKIDEQSSVLKYRWKT